MASAQRFVRITCSLINTKIHQTGTPEALIQNYENVFDDDFLEVLKSEAEPYNHATDHLGKKIYVSAAT